MRKPKLFLSLMSRRTKISIHLLSEFEENNMNDNINDAFTTPKANVSGNTISGSNNIITTGIVDQLKRTRPWVLLISIVGFIFTAIMAIGTLAIFFGGGVAIFSGSGVTPDMSSGIAVIVMGFIYLLMTLLYFVISLFLLKYAGAIKRFIASGTSQDMEAALKYQASFWKVVGILTLVSIVFMVLGIAAGIIGALTGGGF